MFTRATIAAITFALGVPACTNEPGALTLSLAPEQVVIGPNETIRLRATLAAKHGPVCLSRARRLDVTMRPVDHAGPTIREQPFVACGTPYVWLLSLYPAIVLADVVDVADAMNRFEVLRAGETHTATLLLDVQSSSGELYLIDAQRVGRAANARGSLTPGRYLLRARLDNHTDALDTFPAPLFWKPYDRLVVAEATIEVVEPASREDLAAGGS